MVERLLSVQGEVVMNGVDCRIEYNVAVKLFLFIIGLGRHGDGIVLMCAYVVVSGDVTVVLKMFVAVSSFLICYTWG